MATMFKSDLPKRKKVVNRTQSKARAAKRRQQETVKRKVYKAVDKRDNFFCRYCQKSCLFRGFHRHHIVFRSQGGKHETGNIITLCADCHGLVHNRKLFVIRHGDGHITFSEEKP